MRYELVAGLETHVELSTKTKIFCGCTTEFGGSPNTHCCPICIGLPYVVLKKGDEVRICTDKESLEYLNFCSSDEEE